jgi:hypothetical protein
MKAFPPYELLEDWATRADDKSRRLERLYDLTREHAWDGTGVLDELEKKHGGIHVPEEMRAHLGHLFSILVWGELAAWNIAADLALGLEDVEAKMAATSQAFDEARHFTVLREYLRRAKIPLSHLNPYGKRLLSRILETRSLVRKLYGMQLLVENLALSIFKQLAETNVEPVLTELLAYIERDESRHVALGVLYVPKLMRKASPAERALNFAFTLEMTALSIAGGELLDEHFVAIGLDHRELGWTTMRMHEKVIRQMREEANGERLMGVYKLSKKHQSALVEFLHPEDGARVAPLRKTARDAFRRAVVACAGAVA